MYACMVIYTHICVYMHTYTSNILQLLYLYNKNKKERLLDLVSVPMLSSHTLDSHILIAV